jgi:hypothetical protein
VLQAGLQNTKTGLGNTAFAKMKAVVYGRLKQQDPPAGR